MALLPPAADAHVRTERTLSLMTADSFRRARNHLSISCLLRPHMLIPNAPLR